MKRYEFQPEPNTGGQKKVKKNLTVEIKLTELKKNMPGQFGLASHKPVFQPNNHSATFFFFIKDSRENTTGFIFLFGGGKERSRSVG